MYVQRHRSIAVALLLVAASLVCGCDVGGVSPPAPPPPPLVKGLEASFESGLFSQDLSLKNGSGSDLKEVDLSITLYRIDGTRPVVKQFWAEWAQGEVKKVNVNAHNYQKTTLDGKAYQNLKEVKIDVSWTWTWNKKP